MDNILKLILGCLGMVGLVVMLIPNSDPLSADNASQTASDTPPPGVPPPPAVDVPPPPAQDDEFSTGEYVVEDYDIANFGQPMVDPRPPAERENARSEAPNKEAPKPVEMIADSGQGPPPPSIDQ